jgi:hypothetical protein
MADPASVAIEAANHCLDPFNAAIRNIAEKKAPARTAVNTQNLRAPKEAIMVCHLKIPALYSADTALPFTGTAGKLIRILTPLTTARATVEKQGNLRTAHAVSCS